MARSRVEADISEPSADRLHLSRQQWTLLSDDEALVPRPKGSIGSLHGNIPAIPPRERAPRAVFLSVDHKDTNPTPRTWSRTAEGRPL
jgi:hypothetical protein